MEIVLNKDGTIADKVTSRNFQGSSGVNSIVMTGDFTNDSEISVRFRFPDGSLYQDQMTHWQNNQWIFPISEIITEIAGTVMLSFIIKINGKRLTTPTIRMNIESSVDGD